MRPVDTWSERESNGAMALRTSPWPAGVPCWADLSSPDVDATVAFYEAVLPWTFADTGEEFGGYRIAQANGGAAAGVGPQQAPGMPVTWTMYFASDDVDATAVEVRAHGGTVIVDPGDVGDLGRMCIAADPTGAMFGVWQAGTHIGAGIANEPGGITWEDLRSTNPEASIAFYTSVFGLVATLLPEAGGEYSTFRRQDEDWPMGGIGGMEGAPDGTTSHWVVYFVVDDLAAALDAARQNGGTMMAEPEETPYGTMAPVADPHGAVFWLTQPPAGSPQPPRAD